MDLFKDPEPFRLKLSFILRMPPKAHKETQFTRTGIAYSDPGKEAWMIEAAEQLRKYEGWFKHSYFLSLKVVFHCERPTKRPQESRLPVDSWFDYGVELMKRSAPDLDNYEKSLQDVLSRHVIRRKQLDKHKIRVIRPEIRGAGIIEDDSLIVTKTSHKIYAKRGTKPRIEITIRERGHLYLRKKKKK